MSSRRKTSIRTVIAIQMKITHAKKMSVDHRMSKKGYDVALISNLISLSDRVRWYRLLRHGAPESSVSVTARPAPQSPSQHAGKDRQVPRRRGRYPVGSSAPCADD